MSRLLGAVTPSVASVGYAEHRLQGSLWYSLLPSWVTCLCTWSPSSLNADAISSVSCFSCRHSVCGAYSSGAQLLLPGRPARSGIVGAEGLVL